MSAIDLRLFAVVPPAVVELYPAPQLGGSTWNHPPDFGGPRAMGQSLSSGGWGLPPGPVAPSELAPGVTPPPWEPWNLPQPQTPDDLGVPGAGVWGQAPPLLGPAAFGAELPTIESLSAWWADSYAQLHRGIYSRGMQAVTGIQVPVEASDPTKARDYLATLLQQQGTIHHWPPADVAARVQAIQTMPPAGTVVATVDRAIAIGGPPPTWPGAAGWLTVARQLQKSAALVSAGESAGYLQRIPTAAAERVTATWQEVRPIIVEGQKTAREIAQTTRWIGTGVGVGAGAAVAVVGLGVLAAVGGWFFAPELVAGGRAVVAAKTAKDARRK